MEKAGTVITLIDNELRQRNTKQAYIQIANRYQFFARNNGNIANHSIVDPEFTPQSDKLSLNSVAIPVKE